MASGDQPIRYRLSADGAAQTQSAMDSVRQSLQRLDKQGGVTAVSLGDVGAAVGRFASLVGLAGGLSLAGLVGFAKQVADGVDNLNDLRDATGASIENLSALEDIALRTGTSVDVAGDAVVKLNKSLNDAGQNPKSGAAQVIRDLGLSVEELRKLDPVEALQQIAIAFEGVAVDGEKGRHLLELTGKSVKELAPLMKDLAEAGRLNVTVTAQQAEEAERLNKTWSSLKKDGLDLARSVAIPLVEALNQMAGAFKDSDTYAGELSGTAKAMAVPLQTIAVLGVTVADSLSGIGREIGGIVAEAGALLSFNRAAAAVIRQERIADHEAARKSYDELIARIMNVRGVANDALRRLEDRGFTPETRRHLPPLGAESAGGGVGKPDKGRSPLAAAPISQAMADALRAIDQTDVAKIAQVTAALDELFNLRASGIGGDAAVDEAIAKLRDDLEKLRKGADVTISTIASRMEEFRASELALQETVNESLRLDKLADSTRRKLDEWSVFAEEGARNIQDALGTTLEATLSGHFDNIGQLWKSLLIRMASEALSAQIGKELFGDFGSPGKSGGGSIGGIVGQLLSNLPSLFSQLPSFDTGTAYVPRDMVAQVHQGERIVPAAENRRGAGAAPVSITQVFNVAGDVGERTVQLLEGMIQRNNARLQRSMRTGGAWSPA